MLTCSIKYCANDNRICVYPDFRDRSRSGAIPAILKSVSCDTRASGAYFEQVTFERIGFSVQRPRPESH
ncbi:hypothetical protein D4599_08265 [Escherichia coli]|uniref:Uncharacterized protein n=1 Tax=Escherichia coli TaxID=562 RepID=A0A8B3LYN7_ECOLX|nr:hypothetical protein [Escherichia coli]RVE10903.1 hypothetical protein CIG67_17565 [Escherichia coli]